MSGQPADAEVGDELLLLPYEHQPADCLQSVWAHLMRRGAQQQMSPIGAIPERVRLRLIPVRAYDKAHMIVAANGEGREVAAEIEPLFGDPEVRHIHLAQSPNAAASPAWFSARGKPLAEYARGR